MRRLRKRREKHMNHRLRPFVALMLCICMVTGLAINSFAGDLSVDNQRPLADTGRSTKDSGKPISIKGTDTSFSTLKEAVDTANADPNHDVIEVRGDTTEKSNIVVTSDITVVCAGGPHTVTLSPSGGIAVQDGKLTLGEKSAADVLTLSCTVSPVSVKGGEICVHDDVTLKSDKDNALILNGAAASGIIHGGQFEAEDYAIYITNGAKVSQINGGVFRSVNTALYMDADARIGEISNGYFESELYTAVLIRNGSRIDKISGGTIVAKKYSRDISNPICGIAILFPDGKTTGIGLISRTEIRSSGAYGILNGESNGAAGNRIDKITGGTITATMIALQNDRRSEIDEISGGTFSAGQGIVNNGKIKEIRGGTITAASYSGLLNGSTGVIDEISGGNITGMDAGISNMGIITKISGGTVVGEGYAINCTSFNGNDPKQIATISGGVFWGKAREAIRLSRSAVLEPELTTQAKGVSRFSGANGKIFSDESLVTYPYNTKLNAPYHMSIRTQAVSGMTDADFKYLTAEFEIPPKPMHTVYCCYINNSSEKVVLGKYEEGETVTLDAGTVAGQSFSHWNPYLSQNYVWVPWNNPLDDKSDPKMTFTMPTGDVLMNARWVVNTYTVNYDTQGGIPANIQAKTVKWGDTGLLPTQTMTREGYTFNGWFTSPSGGLQVDDSTGYSALVENSNVRSVTLYAKWKANPTKPAEPPTPTTPTEPPIPPTPVTYTVKYLPGKHGTFTPQTTGNLRLGEETPNAPAIKGESGWIFSGWSPTPAATVTGNTVYTARWAKEPTSPANTGTMFTVQFADWNGTILKTQQVKSGGSATSPTNPVREGYIFSGWNRGYTNVSENITVTAQYIVNEFLNIDTIKDTPSDGNQNNGANTDGVFGRNLTNGKDITGNTITNDSSPHEVLQALLEGEGIKSITIGGMQIPLSAGPFTQFVWALVNLILAAIGIVLAAAAFIRAFWGKRGVRNDQCVNEDGKAQRRSGAIWLITAIVTGIGGIILFLLTEDMTRLMVLVDNWTIVNALLLVTEIVGIKFAFRRNRELSLSKYE